MADTEQDERQAPAHAGTGGSFLTRKWHGVPVWGWTLGGTIAAVVVIRWWRNRSASSSDTSGQDTSGGTDTGNCYDISGALVPCAQAAANNASGAGDLGGTLGGIYTGGDGSGSSTGDTGTGDSGTPATGTTAPSSGRLTPPLGLHLVSGGKTGVRVGWLAVPGATGYVAMCKRGGNNGTTVNGPFPVAATQTYANFGGLKAGTQYTALVWPSSSTVEGGPGSNQPHAEYGFTTTK